MRRVIALAVVASVALPVSGVMAKAEGFYAIAASTRYCRDGAPCDFWSGPAPQVTTFVSVFGRDRDGRIGPPESVTLGCFIANTDESGIRHYHYALAVSSTEDSNRGSAGVVTNGDTTLSPAARSVVSVRVDDPTDHTSGQVVGVMVTNNITKTLQSGGLRVSISGELSNWHVGTGPEGQPFLLPDPPTTGSIDCAADTNGIDPEFAQYSGVFPAPSAAP